MRNRKNKSKISFIFVILIFSLVSISYSYAGWNDVINTTGSVNTNDDFNYLCLRGYWKFDENTGDIAYDSSPYENNGEITGASWSLGKIDYALDFDGNGDFVEVLDDDSIDITDEITIMAWIYTYSWDNPTDTYDVRNIIDKGEHTSGNAYGIYSYNQSGDHKLHFRLNKDSNADVTSILPSLNTWHHIAATFDGSILKIYTDGVKTGEKLYSGAIGTNNEPLYIGGAVNRDYWFNGKIDELKIYDCAFTSDEIITVYNEYL